MGGDGKSLRGLLARKMEKKEANKPQTNKPRKLERGLEVRQTQERQAGNSTKRSRQFTH